MKLVPTIGLEIHCELKTNSKIFCSCPNVFGGEPNTHCCPICSGLPGVLPVLNQKAVEYTVKTGLAINADIPEFSKWDRKNYFYPDLPKAWQTSQYDLPLVANGYVDYDVNGEKKRARINRIHLEEDAGKLIHGGGVTRVDYNRCGVPLMEIVTEPDFHSADDVVAFLTELKSIIKYIGVSDAKMQEGSLRCDVNLSLAEEGAPLGTRTETKNLNSFSAAARAIKYEMARQEEILLAGGSIVQETRRFDDAKGEGYGMRGKEDAHDYRYFPEPDLMPVIISKDYLDKIRAEIPPLRKTRADKYKESYGLPDYDAEILTSDIAIANLFDNTVGRGGNPKKVSNFIMSEVMRILNMTPSEDIEIGINDSQLYSLLNLVDDNTISLAAAGKEVLPYIWGKDTSPNDAVEKLGLKQSNDVGEIEEIVKQIMSANEKVVAEYRGGNEKVLSFFVGQVMKATKGKSNPKIVGEVLSKLLKG